MEPMTIAYAKPADADPAAGTPGDYGKPVDLIPSMANRHGLITGATGTGKTVTLCSFPM